MKKKCVMFGFILLISLSVWGRARPIPWVTELNLYDWMGTAPIVVEGEVMIQYVDDVENGSGDWNIAGSDGQGNPGLWHVSQIRSKSPVTSWYYGQETTGNYDTGFANWGTITSSSSIDLSEAVNTELIFWHYLATQNIDFGFGGEEPEITKDIASVLISDDDGVTWTTVLIKGNTFGLWEQEIIDLSAYDGSLSLLVRFSFDTVDSSFNQLEGWYVDDIQLLSTAPDAPPSSPGPGPGSGGHRRGAQIIQQNNDRGL